MRQKLSLTEFILRRRRWHLKTKLRLKLFSNSKQSKTIPSSASDFFSNWTKGANYFSSINSNDNNWTRHIFSANLRLLSVSIVIWSSSKIDRSWIEDSKKISAKFHPNSSNIYLVWNLIWVFLLYWFLVIKRHQTATTKNFNSTYQLFRYPQLDLDWISAGSQHLLNLLLKTIN